MLIFFNVGLFNIQSFAIETFDIEIPLPRIMNKGLEFSTRSGFVLQIDWIAGNLARSYHDLFSLQSLQN